MLLIEYLICTIYFAILELFYCFLLFLTISISLPQPERYERYTEPSVNAALGAFPWIIRQYRDYPYGRCTGVLISSSHILTAGHCISDSTSNIIIEFLNTPNAIKIGAVRYIKHSITDLAIVEIQPQSVCSGGSLDLNTTCANLSEINDILAGGYALEKKLKIIYPSWINNCPRDQILLTYAGVGEFGDSGGPLFYQSREKTEDFNIVGIFTSDNNRKPSTLYFTSLEANRNFIEDHIQMSKTYDQVENKYTTLSSSLNIQNWTNLSSSALSTKSLSYISVLPIIIYLLY